MSLRISFNSNLIGGTYLITYFSYLKNNFSSSWVFSYSNGLILFGFNIYVESWLLNNLLLLNDWEIGGSWRLMVFWLFILFNDFFYIFIYGVSFIFRLRFFWELNFYSWKFPYDYYSNITFLSWDRVISLFIELLIDAMLGIEDTYGVPWIDIPDPFIPNGWPYSIFVVSMCFF